MKRIARPSDAITQIRMGTCKDGKPSKESAPGFVSILGVLEAGEEGVGAGVLPEFFSKAEVSIL